MKKETWSYRLALAFGPRLFLFLENLLFKSCMVKEYNAFHLTRCNENNIRCILTYWHYSMFQLVCLARRHCWVGMVSASKDGEFVARILALLGSETVRGSRNKVGMSALRALLVLMKKGLDAALIADGSQGPERKAQAGAIWLASRTGAVIVPVATAASRYITFKSWDRSVLPLPFSQVALVWGEPLKVPPELEAKDLEPFRLLLEERLNALYQEAWALFGRKGHV